MTALRREPESFTRHVADMRRTHDIGHGQHVQERQRDNRQKVGNGRSADRVRLLSCWNCWRSLGKCVK